MIGDNPVKSIETQAFIGCTEITSITLGANLTSIGNGAFAPCISLENIFVDENNDRFSEIDGVLFNYDQTRIIAHPAAKAQEIFEIPNTVTEISPRAFAWSSLIDEIIIPDSVTTIGYMAFLSCSSLTSIESTR